MYSCWSLTLDLVATHLERDGVAYNRIHNTTAPAERRRLVERFAVDPQTSVLLVTIGAGAFRLDLSCARCVFILEPQWSLVVEREAVARVVGLGKAPESVKVVKYVVKGTVEESWVERRGSWE